MGSSSQCAICTGSLSELSEMVETYPGLVCRGCDERAVNTSGERAEFVSEHDDGDNPVFISGQKCWRRYRFGGFVTMRDDWDCGSLGEFNKRQAEGR